MDPITILTQVITAANSIKSLVDAAGNFKKNSDIRAKITDLLDQLTDAKEKTINLRNELLDLKEENRLLKSKTSEKPVFKNGVCTFPDDEGNYCSKCFEDDTKKIHLLRPPLLMAGEYSWQCPVCKTIS